MTSYIFCNKIINTQNQTTQGAKVNLMNLKFQFINNFFEEPKHYNDIILYQIGEKLCDADTDIKNHIHRHWFEFTYIFSGKGEIFTNNVRQPVGQGDLYISFPKEIHRIKSDNIEPLRFFFIAFYVEDSSSLKPYLDDINCLIADEKQRLYKSNSAKEHFEHLLHEFKNQSDIYNLMFEHELKTVILKIVSKIKSAEREIYKRKENKNNLLCYNIMNYIDNNLTTIGNAAELGKIFGYNYAYLSRFFKNVSGENLSDYIINQKLTLSKKMLEEENLSITEIADELHYSTVHVYSRAFKNYYGISPSDYRNLFNKSNNDI